MFEIETVGSIGELDSRSLKKPVGYPFEMMVMGSKPRREQELNVFLDSSSHQRKEYMGPFYETDDMEWNGNRLKSLFFLVCLLSG